MRSYLHTGLLQSYRGGCCCKAVFRLICGPGGDLFSAWLISPVYIPKLSLVQVGNAVATAARQGTATGRCGTVVAVQPVSIVAAATVPLNSVSVWLAADVAAKSGFKLSLGYCWWYAGWSLSALVL